MRKVWASLASGYPYVSRAEKNQTGGAERNWTTPGWREGLIWWIGRGDWSGGLHDSRNGGTFQHSGFPAILFTQHRSKWKKLSRLEDYNRKKTADLTDNRQVQ